MTQGIVSALGRNVAEPGGVTLPGTIQTSAAINPGNSGGALVDINGEVVGIPTLAAVDQELGGPAPGIGFAIPSNDAKDFAGQMIKNGKVTESHRAYLGIQAANITGAQGAAPGVLVYAVEDGGPASKAGIKEGDLIVSIGGKPVADTNQLSMVLATLESGKAARRRPEGRRVAGNRPGHARRDPWLSPKRQASAIARARPFPSECDVVARRRTPR